MKFSQKDYPNFKKGLKKLKKSGNMGAMKKLKQFLQDLNAGLPPPIDHPLHGSQKGYFSVRLDQKQGLRLVYRTEMLNPEVGVVHLVCLGTHRECDT